MLHLQKKSWKRPSRYINRDSNSYGISLGYMNIINESPNFQQEDINFNISGKEASKNVPSLPLIYNNNKNQQSLLMPVKENLIEEQTKRFRKNHRMQSKQVAKTPLYLKKYLHVSSNTPNKFMDKKDSYTPSNPAQMMNLKYNNIKRRLTRN